MRFLIAAVLVGMLSQPATAGQMVASYYATGSHTASGERFNPHGLTAAHRSLPFGTNITVCYRACAHNVRINDRGPFVRGRHLDVSLGVARLIGLTGVAVVQVY